MIGSRTIAGAGAIVAISLACQSSTKPEAGPPTSGMSGMSGTSGSAPPVVIKPPPIPTCEQVAFAESSPVPEASGAAWLTIDGKLGLLVVSDSGNDGAYALIDPETGTLREQGKLPIGGGSDDLEGLAIRGGKLVGISSSGWIRVWERTRTGFALVAGPYPLGPIDLPDKKRAKPGDPGMVCSERTSNCGRDYEGICLAPSPAGPCLGFAASKTDGRLYCLVDKAGKLAVERSLAIPIAQSGAIADCAFSDRGELFVGSNLFDAANVYRVFNWADPANAQVDKLGALGIGFPETIAARGEVLYRMSDTGAAPSLMTKYRCH